MNKAKQAGIKFIGSNDTRELFSKDALAANTDANGNFRAPEPSTEEMLARISLLSHEMDANDEENRDMQSEIDTLYAKIDLLTENMTNALVTHCAAMIAAGKRIEAVKKYRGATGASLKVAQQALGIR